MNFVDVFVDDVAEQPPPEPPVEHERPEWLGPPSGELGVPVPLGVILGRSQRGVVAISHGLVYSSGVSFDLVAHVGGLKPAETNNIFHQQHAGRLEVEELPDGFLRFGVELADGQRVSNLGQHHRLAGPDANPSGPVLFQNGGGGGQSSGASISWNLSFWLWPLPPEGPLHLYCEWPVAEIQLAHAEIETSPIREAASRATLLWDDGEGGGGWTSAAVGQHVMTSARADREGAQDRSEREATVSLPLTHVRELEVALKSVLSLLRSARRPN